MPRVASSICAASGVSAVGATAHGARCGRGRGGRAILLLNRRGDSGAMHCRAAGSSAASAATSPRTARRRPAALPPLWLHRQLAPTCPDCGSVELARSVPAPSGSRPSSSRASQLPVRLDGDAAAKPGGCERRSTRFSNARAAALIGTQMVAKGHHFPGVAVAAVVDADTGLAFPDFRAEERTFQLVTQLAGRSGRDAPGRCSSSLPAGSTPLAYAAGTTSPASSRRSWRAARSSISAVQAPRFHRRLRL